MRIAIIAVGLYLAFLGVIIYLVIRWGKRMTFGAVDQVKALVQGEAKLVRAGSPAREVPGLGWQRDGQAFEAFVQTIGRYQYMVLRAVRDQLPAIAFRRETRRDRFGKMLRLNRELQTGEPTFDDVVYIESDAADDTLRPFFDHAPFREAVKQAASKLTRFRLTAGGVEVMYLVQRVKRSPALVEDAIKEMALVRDALPPITVPEQIGVVRARGDVLVVASWLLLMAGYLYHMVSGILRPDGFEPIVENPMPAVAALAWMASIPASYFWIKGHSRSLRNWLLFNFASPFVCFIWIPALAFLANAVFDGTSPRLEKMTVRSKKSYSGSRSVTRRFVRVDSWRPEWKTISIRVPPSVYNTAEVDRTAVVLVREGALGWQWVEQVTIL